MAGEQQRCTAWWSTTLRTTPCADAWRTSAWTTAWRAFSSAPFWARWRRRTRTSSTARSAGAWPDAMATCKCSRSVTATCGAGVRSWAAPGSPARRRPGRARQSTTALARGARSWRVAPVPGESEMIPKRRQNGPPSQLAVGEEAALSMGTALRRLQPAVGGWLRPARERTAPGSRWQNGGRAGLAAAPRGVANRRPFGAVRRVATHSHQKAVVEPVAVAGRCATMRKARDSARLKGGTSTVRSHSIPG